MSLNCQSPSAQTGGITKRRAWELRILGALIAFAITLLAGCSAAVPPVCTPGATLACTCATGGPGVPKF